MSSTVIYDFRHKADFAECPSVWTNNGSLLALTQKSFIDAWRASINWVAASSANVPDKVVVVRPARVLERTVLWESEPVLWPRWLFQYRI
ncbi:MAG: hypothetical protein ABSD73_03535 [Candidatus Bathyarchaeia archaeon]